MSIITQEQLLGARVEVEHRRALLRGGRQWTARLDRVSVSISARSELLYGLRPALLQLHLFELGKDIRRCSTAAPLWLLVLTQTVACM